MRSKKRAVPFVLIALVAAWLAGSRVSFFQDKEVEPQAEPIVTERWSGSDRFETAAVVARNSYPTGAETVYLASYKNFADPMIAGQAIPVGPILLAGTVPLHRETCQAIHDLQPATIIVIGGTSSVPESNLDSAETCVEMSPNEQEQALEDLTNQERRDRGLSVLGLHKRLQGDARAWSRHLARQGHLSHTQERPDWFDGELWGENVVGPADDAQQAHDALMGSPKHKENILRDWDFLGYGVVIYKDHIWATQQFIRH